MTEEAEKDKSKFAWVAERSACALPRVFKTLKSEVEEDVRARNALRPNHAPYEFCVEESGNNFSVVLDAIDLRRSITFCLEDHAISVLDSSGNLAFEITLNFNDDGKCVMKAKQENRESWQLRRMALEDLLFRIY